MSRAKPVTPGVPVRYKKPILSELQDRKQPTKPRTQPRRDPMTAMFFGAPS